MTKQNPIHFFLIYGVAELWELNYNLFEYLLERGANGPANSANLQLQDSGLRAGSAGLKHGAATGIRRDALVQAAGDVERGVRQRVRRVGARLHRLRGAELMLR